MRARRAAASSPYVALGDSFTAGRDSIDGERWADLLAAGLRARQPGPALREPRGRRRHQRRSARAAAEPALALEPDLVTVICGANDVLLTTRPDVAGYAERLRRRSSRRLREGAPEAALVTATAPESWHFMELRPRTEGAADRGDAPS